MDKDAMDKDAALRRFLLSTPQKYLSANGDNRICGVIVDIETTKNMCTHIEPVIFPSFPTESKR